MSVRFVSILVIGLLAGAWAQQGPVEVMHKVRGSKVVVTDYYFGFHHNVGRPLVVAMMQEIGEDEGFEVVVVPNDNDLTSDVLADAKVLVMQNLSDPNRMGNTSKAAVQQFVEGGGGLFAIHATLSAGAWDWLLQNGIHGNYVRHSAIVPAEMYIDDEAYDDNLNLHPVLEGLDELDNVSNGVISGWREEWFNWNNYFRGEENLTILIDMNTDSYDCNCTIGDDHPAMWIQEKVGGDNGGMVEYFLAGHGNEVFESRDAGLKLLYRNSILYLGGTEVRGCTDSNYVEFNTTAEADNGSCTTLKIRYCPDSSFQEYYVENKNWPDPSLCQTVAVGPSTEGPAPQITFDIATRIVSAVGSGNGSISVRNLSGETVYSNKGNSRYDLSGVSEAGIYFIEVRTASGRVVKRVTLW